MPLYEDEIIAGYEKQIRRKEEEIKYLREWILKLKGQQTLSEEMSGCGNE